MNTQKIHLINRIDETNIGDLVCSPYIYYYDFFKDYNVIRHDIEQINWVEISKHDVVIIGGGGMLYYYFQENLNKLLNICPTVIVWSIGFNTHYDNPIDIRIDTDKIKLIGIRDYSHPSGLPYLPCVSCLAIELDKVLEIKRPIGIINHKYFPVTDDIPGERINNTESFQTITDFIASSEIVISSSYHNIYWAVLMGKKVICANPFSTKFEYFQYKPVFYSGDLEKDIAEMCVYPLALAGARELNADFFEKVKEIVQEVIPKKNKYYQYIYDTTIPAILRRMIWAEVTRLHEITTYLDGEKNHLYNEINSLHEKENLSNVEIQSLHGEINSLNREINSLHEKENLSNVEIQSLHEEINSLHKEVAEKTSLRHFAKNVKEFLCNRIHRKERKIP